MITYHGHWCFLLVDLVLPVVSSILFLPFVVLTDFKLVLTEHFI